MCGVAVQGSEAGGRTPGPQSPNPIVIWAVLALIIAVGAALRLYGLDHQSLWNDELGSWYEYGLTKYWLGAVRRVSTDHAPAYWILMHGWLRWFGDSETMLRLPAALMGIATIPAMFALGRRLYGPREGLLAAALTATAWMPVYYSQEARPYALLLLVVVVSTCCLLDIVQALRAARAPALPATIGYVLCAEVACYTHYSGLLFVALQAAMVLFLFVRQPAALRRLAIIYGAILLGYIPWLGRASMVLSFSPRWLPPPTPYSVVRFVGTLFNRSNTIAVAGVALWATLLAGMLVRARQAGARDRALRYDALLFAWLVAPVVILYVRSFVVGPAFGDRYLIFVVPAAYLLVARAILQLPVRPAVTMTLAIGLPALLLLHLVVVARYFSAPAKSQFREAAAYLVRNDTPDTKALVVAGSVYFDYYLARLGSPRRVDHVARSADDRSAVAELIATRSPDAVWLLSAHRRPPPELVSWLADELQLVSEAHLYDAEVWHFVPRANPRTP